MAKKPQTNRPRKLSIQQPKPCPTCYSPMSLVGKDAYECSKHGAPTKR